MELSTAMVEQMPKIELHVHLESTIDGGKLERYAEKQGKRLQRPGKEIYQCTADDLSDFLSFLDDICSMVGSSKELEEIAYDFSMRSREENIIYAETILNPTHWPQFTTEEIIDALTKGFNRGGAKGGADCHFTLSLSRNQRVEEAECLVAAMEAFKTPRLVGISIDGNESLTGRTGEKFAKVFQRAKEAGFGITVHAGESSGPEGVEDALDYLKADRLDHGVRATESGDLILRLVDEGVPMNLCLTSNLTLLYKDSSDHPLRRLWDAGAKITLNRDDPTFLDLSLTEELLRCAKFAGFTVVDLLRAQYHAVDAAFCDNEMKRVLRRVLDTYRSSF